MHEDGPPLDEELVLLAQSKVIDGVRRYRSSYQTASGDYEYTDEDMGEEFMLAVASRVFGGNLYEVSHSLQAGCYVRRPGWWRQFF